MAKDLYTQFPESIDEDPDGMPSVNHTKFPSVLVDGMEEQQRNIVQQGVEIQELKSMVEKITNHRNLDTLPASKQ